MAIKKFASLNEALAAGFRIILGNDEYAEGGETMPRERYAALFDVLKDAPPSSGETFILPDSRGPIL